MTTVDRDSPVPLYYQLKQILLGKIEAGEWTPGDLISSENELQDTYGVSRTTVRQTLADLVNEGHLVRHQGRGTFVSDPRLKLAHNPAQTQGITFYMEQQGITPGWEVLSADFQGVKDFFQDKLQIDRDTNVFAVRRLRLADDEPIGHHTAFVPEAIYAALPHGDLPELLLKGESLRYLQDHPAMATSHAQRTIEAVSADKIDSKLTGIEIGAPVLQIERLVTAVDGTPLEYLTARYRGDRFKYQIS